MTDLPVRLTAAPEQLRRARDYIEGIREDAENAGPRGLTKGQTENVVRDANAALAAIKSAEYAAGIRKP